MLNSLAERSRRAVGQEMHTTKQIANNKPHILSYFHVFRRVYKGRKRRIIPARPNKETNKRVWSISITRKCLLILSHNKFSILAKF